MKIEYYFFLERPIPATYTHRAGEPLWCNILLFVCEDLLRKLHSRFLGPIALVVDSCGDADHNGREEVTGHVVVLFP